jgi:hypothetical protein
MARLSVSVSRPETCNAPVLETPSAGAAVVGVGAGNRLGTRWRGQIPIPPKAHPLVRRLIRIANARQVTLTEIALESGVSPKTISDWRYRSAPSLTNFEAALNALGYEIKIVERKGGSAGNG